MNSISFLKGVLSRGIKPVFASSSGPFAQQTRNTFILKRAYPVNLHKIKEKRKMFKHKHFIYQLVENTNVKPQKPIDVILTTFVTGVGIKGEKLSMPPNQAYNKLLLPGLAVYASPENIEVYKDIIEKAKNEIPVYSSKWAPRTMNILQSHLLTVIVSLNSPWTLQKYHIRAAFRKVNIHVPDHAITMPEREISGPDLSKQNKEFYITVTINKREQAKVRCRLHHFTNVETDRLPSNGYWKKKEPAIFPEDQPILDAMTPHRCWTNEDETVSA